MQNVCYEKGFFILCVSILPCQFISVPLGNWESLGTTGRQLCSCYLWHFYDEASATSADLKLTEIKCDPGLLGCLIIIMPLIMLQPPVMQYYYFIIYVYLTL